MIGKNRKAIVMGVSLSCGGRNVRMLVPIQGIRKQRR